MKPVLSIPLVSSFLVLSACSDPNGAGGGSQERLHAIDSADSAWDALTGNHALTPLRGEAPFPVEFMVAVDEQNTQRRKLGIEFWDDYPDDERRYEWLLQTMLMPPSYAIDREDWAERSLVEFGSNGAEIDQSALQSWNANYRTYREEFLGSDWTTDKDRRLLRIAELDQQLQQLKIAHRRGAAVDGQKFVEAFLNFASAHPEPFEDYTALKTEESFHAQVMTYFWHSMITLDGRDALEWDEPKLDAFMDRFESLGIKDFSVRADGRPGVVERLRETIEADGGLPNTRVSLAVAPDASDDVVLWATVSEPFRIPYRLAGDSAGVGEFVSSYFWLLDRVRYRAFGKDVYERSPILDARWRWLKEARVVDYFGTSIAHDAERLWSNPQSVDLTDDETWRLQWEQEYERLSTDFLNMDGVTDYHRAGLAITEIQLEYLRLSGDIGATERVHEQIHKYHQAFPDFSDMDYVSERFVREPHRFGLGINDLIEFVEPFRASKSLRLQRIVEMLDRRIAFLMDGRPVEAEGPLLGGGTLSLADLRGSFVYIDPWTTSCGSCIEAMPELHQTYLEYKDRGFEFVSLVYDGELNPRGVSRYVDELELTWPVLVGDSMPGERLPYLLLNRDGTVYAFHDRDEVALADLLDEAFASEGSE